MVEPSFQLDFVAKNFRGFRNLDFSLRDVTFVVGDNSSGKTSVIYLVQHVLKNEFINSFSLIGGRSRFSTTRDVLSPYINSDRVTLGFFIEGKTRKAAQILVYGWQRFARSRAHTSSSLKGWLRPRRRELAISSSKMRRSCGRTRGCPRRPS
ncbi:AAA family ATPase [Bradyrhizobium betae]